MALKSAKVNQSDEKHDNNKIKTGKHSDTSKIKKETKKKTKLERKRSKSSEKTQLHSKRSITFPLTQQNQLCNMSLTTPVSPLVTMYYPQNYNFPVSINEWNPIIPIIQSPLYSLHPMPIIINPTQMIAQIVPYAAPIAQPVLPVVTPIISNGATVPEFETYANEELEIQYATNQIGNNIEVETSECVGFKDEEKRCVDFYITLPRELFPAARMLTLDPNPIIDEFCKIPNVQQHAPWILDLEFGVPKAPITRPIPIYNVKFNSVHCRNTPEAIHPGFERCTPDFKRVLSFYYDCIISAWYRGYVIMNYDKSVENFQSWLLLPMQVLGMCWP